MSHIRRREWTRLLGVVARNFLTKLAEALCRRFTRQISALVKAIQTKHPGCCCGRLGAFNTKLWLKVAKVVR
jgi:hypothetical protein